MLQRIHKAEEQKKGFPDAPYEVSLYTDFTLAKPDPRGYNDQGFCLNGGITMEEHANDNRTELSQQQPITEDKRVPFAELIVEIRY